MTIRGRAFARSIGTRVLGLRIITQSPQQLDPFGGFIARVLVIVGVSASILVAVVMSLLSAEQVSSPQLQLAAIGAITAAGLFYVYASSPFRAPFGRREHALVGLLILVAVVLEALAQLGTNTLVRDDWAPIAAAILTLTLGSFRPPWEILLGAIITAGFIGWVTLLGAGSLQADVPPAVFALLESMPVLACGLAAAAFSRSLVRDLNEWKAAPFALPVAGVPWLASHRALAEEQALPFLAAIADAPAVTAADGERARALSRELRALMILDDEATWVSRLVVGANDPLRLATALTSDQRGCLRAIVNHVRSSADFESARLELNFLTSATVAGQAECVLVISAEAARSTRVKLAPFAAIARTVFADAAITFAPDAVSCVFRFDAPSARAVRAPRPSASAHPEPQDV